MARNIKCLIVEDQAPAQRILIKYINDLESLELKETFSDALKALEYLKNNEIDLIFLDIHLPKLSGIDFLKVLPNPPKIILTTAFSEYAVESYELDVEDYLLKPFSFERFVKAVSKVTLPQPSKSITTEVDKECKDELFIKSGHEYIKIKISEILFIQSDMDYTEINTFQKKYLSQETLLDWEQKLKNYKFMRVHRSYIINISKISKVTGNQLTLEDETTIPIGRTYKEDFAKIYN